MLAPQDEDDLVDPVASSGVDGMSRQRLAANSKERLRPAHPAGIAGHEDDRRGGQRHCRSLATGVTLILRTVIRRGQQI